MCRIGGTKSLDSERPVRLLDDYSQFRRAIHTCKCGWLGTGAMMKNGECTGLGIDKHCPACRKFYGFAKVSVLVEKGTPDDWPPEP